jgi:molybdopterin/thiamine biosynthesis adenylyltransferase
MFTDDQLHRYSRHIILKGFGPRAQKKLLDSSVLVIGAGGLGSPALLYLAAAGTGKIESQIRTVEISNLQRQILYSQKDLNTLKAEASVFRLSEMNSDVQIYQHTERIDQSNILDIIKGYDFIIDGTDSQKMKFLINDACVLANKPFSHAEQLNSPVK